MKETIYPTLSEALYLHKLLIKKFGGDSGVRDLGLLESALARMRSGYYVTLSSQAAALFQSMICNHCFIDGNKRIGFALTAVFLKLNGYNLKVKADIAETFIVNQIIKGKADVKKISQWLENHMLEIKQYIS